MSGRSVQAQVAAIVTTLPASQQRVAELVVRDPEAIAFGTVQSVAEQSGTSPPTVVRFAASLGFDGYSELRDAVRSEVSERLRSAATRIGRTRHGPLLEQALAVERANVERTIAGLDEADVVRAAELLADPARRVWVLPSSQLAGLAAHIADDLRFCRGRVELLDGPEFRVHTLLAGVRDGDVVLSFDIQRHEAALVRAQRAAVAGGATPIAVTDRLPCSLDLAGGVALPFACETTGPFESQVGALVVANLLVSEVADRRQDVMAPRLAALEQHWTDGGLFER